MREIKLKQCLKNGHWLYLSLSKVRLAEERPETLSEYIGLVDYNGQDIYTNDLVIIENNLIHKQFRIVFNQELLAFGFQSEDKEKRFYTLKMIKAIYENYTITKVGSIFKGG